MDCVIRSVDDGIGDEFTTAALLEVVQTVHLAGHFQLTTIDGIMPAFDVDGADKTAFAQDGDDIAPVGVTETGGAVVGKWPG